MSDVPSAISCERCGALWPAYSNQAEPEFVICLDMANERMPRQMPCGMTERAGGTCGVFHSECAPTGLTRYIVEFRRLGEQDWIWHLSGKLWLSTPTLAIVARIQTLWLARQMTKQYERDGTCDPKQWFD